MINVTFGGTAPVGSTVNVYVDTVIVGTTTADSAGNWVLTVELSDGGAHSVYASADNLASTPQSFTTLSNPTVAVPADTTASPIVAVNGTAPQGSGVDIYYANGTRVTANHTFTMPGTTEWTVNAGLPNGNLTIYAVATNGSNTITGPSTTFNVNVNGTISGQWLFTTTPDFLPTHANFESVPTFFLANTPLEGDVPNVSGGYSIVVQKHGDPTKFRLWLITTLSYDALNDVWTPGVSNQLVESHGNFDPGDTLDVTFNPF